MDITGCTIWQQASGDTHRDYAKVCIDNSVILNGWENTQGDDDAAFPNRRYLLDGSYEQTFQACRAGIVELPATPNKKRDLLRFCEEMKIGDLVVLRRGSSTALAVGVVKSAANFNEHFSDIDGWNIPYLRSIEWIWVGLSDPKDFGAWSMKFGDTTQLLSPDSPVVDWLQSLEPNRADCRLARISDYPAQRRVTPSDVSAYLFDRGIDSNAINKLSDEMGELQRIAKWYSRSDEQPSERETIAYLVVPLLRALGWTPQRMAVEWNRVDVALFAKLPRTDQTLRAVTEVKRLYASCLTAESQATRYAEGKRHCRRLILTDGLRYAVHTKVRYGTDYRLTAYLNLTRMRDIYPALGCRGAAEAMALMAPENLPI